MTRQDIHKKAEPENVQRAAEIYAEYGDFILAVLRSQVHDQSLVEDLFQSFFLSLVARPVPHAHTNIKSHIYQAICHDIIDAVRRTQRHRRHLENYSKYSEYLVNEEGPEDAIEMEDAFEKVLECIRDHLQPAKARAVELRFLDQNSVPQVADKMGVDVRSVSRYVSVALQKIRTVLGVD